MKYAKVRNGKIVATQSGLQPVGADWFPVVKKWEWPTEFPSNFYIADSNIPRLAVVGEGAGQEVHETWNFTLQSADSIKVGIYHQLKDTRKGMTFGTLTVEDVTILIEDSHDITVVTNMGNAPIRFKRGTRDRISLTAAQALEFKIAFEAKIQDNFDWEEVEEDTVYELTTHEQLAAYLAPPEAP